MNDSLARSPKDQGLPPVEPVIRNRRWPYALIWMIPAVSLLCAGLYLRDYLTNHGPEMIVDFADASGVRVGEAKILYRGAEIGRVTSIELSENHKRALVHVQLDKQEAIFATKGASFWIVRPEVSESGFSGLGTLFSGPYIAATPGNGEENVKTMEGLARPPRAFEAGETFQLIARRMGHVQEGSAVSYKGVQVGSVQKVTLANEADHLNVEILVWTRYAPLVRANSKFWVSSGFDMEGGIFSGLHLKLDSLKTLTTGGIAFATPEKEMGPEAKRGTAFPIEEDPKKEWDLWSPKISIAARSADTAPKSEPLPQPKREKEK